MSAESPTQPQLGKKLKVIVAGSTGFLGAALGKFLATNKESSLNLIGLSRSGHKRSEVWQEVKQCDLFSLNLQTIGDR